MTKKLASRPIPLDQNQIAALAAELLSKLERTDEGFLLGADEGGPDAKAQTKIKDMKGVDWLVKIQLKVWNELGSKFNPTSTIGGSVKPSEQLPDAAFIQLKLNDANLAMGQGLLKRTKSGQWWVGKNGLELSPDEALEMDKARLAAIQDGLAHELTHVADPQSGTFAPKSWNQMTPEEKTKYVSQPTEIRAFLAQVVNEIKRAYLPDDDVKTLLEKSTTWKNYLVWATPKMKGKIVSAVQQWLDEIKSVQPKEQK